MKRILFTHSYFLRLDPKQWQTGQPYPPLGTLYAAALMRENGYDVRLHDTMFAEGPGSLQEALDSFDPEILVIYDDGFNYLTKMCLTNMREAAFRMCAMGKQKGCTVIISSSDATDHFEKYLAAGADFVLIGEAEYTLLELVNTFPQDKDRFSHIHGLAYNNNGVTMKTAKRQVIKELDTLPMPAWDLVPMQPYRDMWMKSNGYFSLNIGTTRGCPFKCNWCAKPIYGNRYNARSPENVVQELVYLKEHYGFDHIWFCDDIFGLKPGWVQQFAELVQAQHLSLRFKIQSRADLLLQEQYVSALAAAGCENVWMGAESGSQAVLDAMDKGITVEQIHAATRSLKEHGIHPSFFIQFGYPGETRQDIRKTVNMINTLLPHSIGISVSYPLPGTVFYERVKQQLHEKANWTDSDELHLMFRNHFRPEFYKQLHHFVHRSHRRNMALHYWRELWQRRQPLSIYRIRKALALLYCIPLEFMAAIKLRRLEKNISL